MLNRTVIFVRWKCEAFLDGSCGELRLRIERLILGEIRIIWCFIPFLVISRKEIDVKMAGRCICIYGIG